MKKVATAKEMKQIDTLATNSYGIEGLKLMENAWDRNRESPAKKIL